MDAPAQSFLVQVIPDGEHVGTIECLKRPIQSFHQAIHVGIVVVVNEG